MRLPRECLPFGFASPTVSGVVVNEAGTPVAGAEVVAIQASVAR